MERSKDVFKFMLNLIIFTRRDVDNMLLRLRVDFLFHLTTYRILKLEEFIHFINHLKIYIFFNTFMIQ